jgi:hypothetical protein
VIIRTLLAANIIVTIFILVQLFSLAKNLVEIQEPPVIQGQLVFDNLIQGQYLLYIGLNDKDTYEQIIPTDIARGIISEIVSRHVGGWTITEARGGWVDETGVLTTENTLIYSFIYVEESDIIAIMQEVLVALNQNTILVERRDVSSLFFGERY